LNTSLPAPCSRYIRRGAYGVYNWARR
jgi:hypothetical protein